jgi:divalent metal cation (Fe/Co/Zn/Cd) transporter
MRGPLCSLATLRLHMTIAVPFDRQQLVHRSKQLNYATLAYNSFEGAFAVAFGLVAGSIALVGFGVDSLIELAASLIALWRLRADVDVQRREHAEYWSLRIIGLSFLALALYVGIDAVRTLASGAAPDVSWVGIVLASISLVVMPVLSRAKRLVALQLRSGALVAEAKQTMICTYLSALLLVGLVLNALAGWWWADPVAALAMMPLIAWEGIEGLRGHSACADDCGPMSGAA